MEIMRKLIFENGGIVVESDLKSNFVIFADGFDKDVWKRGGVDQLNRNIVHFRWIEECIKSGRIVNHSEAIHLQPMPQQVPLPQSQRVTVAFALVQKAVDKLIFKTIADINGLVNDFKEKQTEFIIIIEEGLLNQSQKLKLIKRWKKKPHVVNIDWLLDSLEQGKIIQDMTGPNSKYLIDY